MESAASALPITAAPEKFRDVSSLLKENGRTTGPCRPWSATAASNLREDNHDMKIDKYIYYPYMASLVLLAAATASPAEDNEDFNWTEASQFVDSFPFKQKFIDSLVAAYQVAFPAPPLRTIPQQSFAQGEVLVYDIGWSFIRAGYVILTATPDAQHRTIKLGGKGLSRGFVSTFYRMRDYVISTIDAAGLYPLFFEEHLREGKHYSSDRWILYDHARNNVYVKGRSVSAPEFTNDYISVLYMARSRQFAPGDTFSLPFFVDGKIYHLMFSCKKRETIDYNGKDIRCLVVQPQPADDKGAFNKKKGLEIWFSDDAAKTPLKIKAKITIGSITANLVYAGRPKNDNPVAAKKNDPVKTPRTGKIADGSKVRNRDTLRSGDTVTTEMNEVADVHDSLKTADTVKMSDTSTVPVAPETSEPLIHYEAIDTHGTKKPHKTSKACCHDNEDGVEPEPGCSRDNSY